MIVNRSNSLCRLCRCTLLLGVIACYSRIGLAAPIAVVQEPIYDVGAVFKGEQITHSFSIQNSGDTSLHLAEVQSSCGCTVLKYDEIIEAGSSGQVEVTLDTANLKGPLAKSIAVLTNDATNPKLSLVVKADVKIRIEAQPNYARFMTVYGQREQSITIAISSKTIRDFRVEGVESPYPFLKVDYQRQPGDETGAGHSWELNLKLISKAPVGPLADFVVVRTNHPEMPELRIPVSGFVRPVLAVSPRIADFGNVELVHSQMTSLEVRNLGADEVSLHDVQVDLEGVQGAIEAIQEGKIYKVSLTLSPGMPKGDFKGTLRIKTSSPLQPTVEVELQGRIL